MQVELTEVGHRFASGPWLFHALTFTFVPGEVYALVGPSGSGKSTLLSLLARWEQPSAGMVRHRDIDRVSWVFQNPHGTSHRSVIDHVCLPLLARGRSPREAVNEAGELLEAFGLGFVAGQPFSSLSGGEAQRLMLARGVATKPQLFLVDEPTAQLDLVTRRDVNATLRHLVQKDAIVVIATHDQETRRACTAVVDLQDWVPE